MFKVLWANLLIKHRVSTLKLWKVLLLRTVFNILVSRLIEYLNPFIILEYIKSYMLNSLNFFKYTNGNPKGVAQ